MGLSSMPANHPIWKILRQLVVGGMLLAFLALGYNKLDDRDFKTIAGVMASLAGFDILKAKVSGEKKDSSDQSAG